MGVRILRSRALPLGSAWILVALSLLALSTLLPDLGGEPLWSTDEARRTLVPTEMLATGDWVVPRLLGTPLPYYPPLGYWAVALTGLTLGIDETTARLPSVLAAFGLVLVVYWIGTRTMDRGRGAAAAALLASTAGFVHLGRHVGPDMLLVLCQTLSLAFFIEWLRDRQGGVRVRRWILPGLVCSAALGILAKGPVAVGFPLVVGIGYAAATRRLHVVRAFPWLKVGLAVLILAAPWYLALGSRAGADFLYSDLIVENVLAPAGLDKHVRGPGFYPPRLLVASLPWSLVLLPVALIGRSWRRLETRLGWSWLILLLGVLSASASKRHAYLVFLYLYVLTIGTPGRCWTFLLLAPGVVLARDAEERSPPGLDWC